MDQAFIEVAAQVIPVLLLAGALEDRLSPNYVEPRPPRPTSMQQESSEESDELVPADEAKLIELIANIDATVAIRRSFMARNARAAGKYVAVVAWLALFVGPAIGLVGEGAALLWLSGETTEVNGTLTQLGVIASLGYVTLPLLMRFWHSANDFSRTLRNQNEEMDRIIANDEANGNFARSLLEQIRAQDESGSS
jgi:hypothetical protein